MRTDLVHESAIFGHTVEGVPLRCIPPNSAADLMIIAGVHGEEPETSVTLSRALRRLEQLPAAVSVVICVNPDGALRGTRGNANGVDLNRNFPTLDWQAAPVNVRWHSDDDESRVVIKTGTAPGSEPETQALISLIERQNPKTILALHAPLACVDDPMDSELGQWLARRTERPLVTDIGYPVPGSMGTWATENDRHLITWEFPKASVEELSNELGYVDILCELITAGRGRLR